MGLERTKHSCYNAHMSGERDKTIRWRPRFSVRALLILVTLVCCYVACWGPTRRQGFKDVVDHVRSSIDLDKRFKTAGMPSSNLPLVVWISEAESAGPEVLKVSDVRGYHRCYLWLFGYVVKLPVERDINPRDLGMP